MKSVRLHNEQGIIYCKRKLSNKHSSIASRFILDSIYIGVLEKMRRVSITPVDGENILGKCKKISRNRMFQSRNHITEGEVTTCDNVCIFLYCGA